ncbi:MAG: tRNA (adenosine(37)-N6)-threonylcarbamoyltransferase complex ATPase subunit type 1 TsaE [Candidatus Aminicenantaceae bacterium]
MSKSRQREENYITNSEHETFLLGKKLAESFRGEEVVLLIGELGAGKTVFTKGIASGLGLKDIHQVCSPSFTLVNIYRAKHVIYHVDLYRLEKSEEIIDLGWEDFLGQGVIVVEWAEKIAFKLEAIKAIFKVGKEYQREIKILS